MKIINDIAKKYGIPIITEHEDCNKNQGSSTGDKIFLGIFNDPEIKIAAFFHELGHILTGREMTRTHYMSNLSQEGIAWERGFHEAHKHGFLWDYNSHVMKWARSQLRTYINGEYDDTKP